MATARWTTCCSNNGARTVCAAWHASDYVWEVGTALHGERNPRREVWVEDKLRALLHSQVGRVIGGRKQIATKNRLTAAQAQALRKAVTDFEKHRHMMDYATYLCACLGKLQPTRSTPLCRGSTPAPYHENEADPS